MKNAGPKRLHWDDAPVFLAIARQGTLSAAATELGLGVATVSRRIERLEEALGHTLFLRHQSGYHLSREGEALLPRAEQLEQAMHGFQQQPTSLDDVSGHVRLATAETLANDIIIPSLASLLASYPELTVEVLTDTSTVNLHGHDADLAVRMSRPGRGNLKIRRIGSLHYGLYGSDSYLHGRSLPGTVSSGMHDRYIGWAQSHARLPAARWLEQHLQGRPLTLATTTLSAQVKAAQAGIGLAVLPDFVTRHTELQRLPALVDVEQPIWLVVHADLSASRRIRVVADHVVSVLQDASSGLME